MDTVWHLEWPHGHLDVHAKGGMLSDVTLVRGKRQLQPFYEAPWIGDASAHPPGLLGHMRSEFPCVPFGTPWAAETVVDSWQESLATPVREHDYPLDASDDLLHGYACTGDWTLLRQTELEIQVALEYPPASSIARVVRVIRADPDGPAIDFVLKVQARKRTRRPIGLHPNLALPSVAGAFQIQPGTFQFGVVHPGGPEPGVSRADPGAIFNELDKVPLRTGGTGGFDRFPFAHDTEEIVQLCGTDGSVVLTDDESQVAYRLSWDAAVLPSLLLWISNRGRSHSPWNSRNLCLGVEPVASAFELGCRAALSVNPINERGVPTAVVIEPGEPVEIAYRFEVLTQ
ncbi:hypothetical protein [Paraburkholderia sp. MM5384-R2]|uniref:hypothetical protein n=1 Tax=Paraburkholderia sp. MM5384-R2 TaxID=2723097 RepID=UPI0017C60436|nr:hypothetical protein [Paraburkholderia sp. MM5384-R2]MBB5501976.1 hypothetical protein [Paraburkholderia sp. MM5384-R2]